MESASPSKRDLPWLLDGIWCKAEWPAALLWGSPGDLWSPSAGNDFMEHLTSLFSVETAALCPDAGASGVREKTWANTAAMLIPE